MEVKYIKIELVPDAKDGKHATILEYKDGLWDSNGPVYPRISGVLREVYELIRGRRDPK